MQKLKAKLDSNNHSGFVILFAVVFSSILLAVGLGVANVALKEINFSTSARSTNDSFLAADMGIECALFNDQSGGTSFVESGGSGVVNCFSNTFALNAVIAPGGISTWSFTIPPGSTGSLQNYCSLVSVMKDNSNSSYIKTTIVSKGYNVGDSNCGFSNLNRIERELKVVYSTIPIPEPVAFWKFDEGSGVTANDSSFGGTNDATLSSGATWNIGGIEGSALSMIGGDEIVSAGSPAALDDLGPLTFSVFIRPTSTGEGGVGTIISKSTSGSYNGDLRLNLVGTNAVSFSKQFSGGGISNRSANNFITLGVWNHLVVTWTGSNDADSIRIYKVVNGVAIETSSYQNTLDGSGSVYTDGTLNFYVGNVHDRSKAFNGLIDEVKVFDRALTKYEIETFLP